MKASKQHRNWSDYNHHLKRHARLDLFISPSVFANRDDTGPRRRGGAFRYCDEVIEMCLMIREYFGLGLRQTQGFIQSVLDGAGIDGRVPDYTTLSRRAARLCLDLNTRRHPHGMVVALDATGLSVHRRDEWNRAKHGRADGRWQATWRKLHIALDTASGTIVAAAYSRANVNDHSLTPCLLRDIPARALRAVCADMAYDTLGVRRLLYEKQARQLIPPVRKARLSQENKNLKAHALALKERDEAVAYIRCNTINADAGPARAQWKQKSGYHTRSLVETAFWRLKTHTGTRLTNRTETNRQVQALIKCKLLNQLNNA